MHVFANTEAYLRFFQEPYQYALIFNCRSLPSVLRKSVHYQMYPPSETKKLFTGNRTVTSKLISLKPYSCWMIVTSTDTGLNQMSNGNYLKISEIFTLTSSIYVYLRHATSPAGINFLDLLNLIPIIMVKRKAETVKDNSTYLCSHVSQWTIQEHGELSKVIAIFAMTWNLIKHYIRDRVYKNTLALPKYTAMISFSYKQGFHMHQSTKSYSTDTK